MVSECDLWMSKCMVFHAYMCVGASERVRTSVCPGSERGGALLTQPEPPKALNHRCYLVSQVLRLCCSNATGAKTFPCKRWFCVSVGEAPRLD